MTERRSNEDDTFRGLSSEHSSVTSSETSSYVNALPPRDPEEEDLSPESNLGRNEVIRLEAALYDAAKARDWLQVQGLAQQLLDLEGNSQASSPISTIPKHESLLKMRHDRLTVFQAEPLCMDGLYRGPSSGRVTEL